jgi:signal transduction histidine kinase
LAAVRLRADTLESYVAEEGRSTYGAMTSELDRFENLLQQLLRLARAEQLSGSRQVGLDTTANESTDLGDVIGERVAFWQPVADKRNQQLGHRTDRPGLSAQVARHEIEQLLDVALDNAIRYAGPDTTVTVSTAPSDEFVDLIISDNGSGLPDEHLSKAAGRFWRGGDDRTGTGLGLAIAAEIIAGHGGTIGVERAPEGGLLIRYRLPLAGEPT